MALDAAEVRKVGTADPGAHVARGRNDGRGWRAPERGSPARALCYRDRMRRSWPVVPAFALLAVAVLAPRPLHATAAPAKSGTAAPAKPAPAEVLPWIADDYDRALAVARERKLPLFIDSWAPW